MSQNPFLPLKRQLRSTPKTPDFSLIWLLLMNQTGRKTTPFLPIKNCCLQTPLIKKQKNRLALLYNNKGVSCALQGKKDDAIAAYKEALQNKEDFSEVYNNLGAAYVDKGMIDDAIVTYKKALTISPNFGEVYNNLGVAYTKKKGV